MKKQTIAIVLGIMLISLALAYFPGETIQVKHNFESNDITLSIIDNKSFVNVSDFILETNTTHANITFPQDLIPQEFKIVLTYLKEQESETIIVHSRSSRTKIVYENITEYVDLEKIIYINNTIEKECPSEIIEPKLNFFQRIWAWIKGIFKK